jgi:haloacetate dehalogenase
MGEVNYTDHLLAIRVAVVVSAMVGNCRAGLVVCRVADDADRAAGRRLACPTLACHGSWWSLRVMVAASQ